jgi:hypothetical protein
LDKDWRRKIAAKSLLKATEPMAEMDVFQGQPWQRREVGIALQALAEEDEFLAAEEDDLYPWPLRQLLNSKAA